MTWRIRLVLCCGWALLMQGCATYVATSGRVAVKDDRPVSRQEQKPATSTAPAAHARSTPRDARVAMVAGFSTRDRLTIEEYFDKQRSATAKRESLPSGFSPQDRLPASIHGQPLPRTLESRLTVLPDAYTRLQVGQDVLLMERESRLVLDLLRGVIAE